MDKLDVVKNMGPMGPRGLGPIKKRRKEGPGGRTGRTDGPGGRTGRAEGPGGRTGRKDRAEGLGGRTDRADGCTDQAEGTLHPPKIVKIICF